MSTLFEKFNSKFNPTKLAGEVKELAANNKKDGDFTPVEHGTYEVKVDKMELRETKTTGKPMVSIWFKILAGDRKNSYIFMNQVIDNSYGVHNMNELLKSLDSGLEISFENYDQYNNLLLDVHEGIDGKLEYALEYGDNGKGFDTFKIKEVFEV